MRQQEFLNTFGIVKDLDFCTPAAFPLLYAFKLADLKAQVALSEEVAEEFKCGKNDPATLNENYKILCKPPNMKKSQFFVFSYYAHENIFVCMIKKY